MKTYRLYINGEFVSPQSDSTIDVIDPSTTDVIARVPNAGAADVDRAAKAARAAFDAGPWKDATAQDRGRVLFRLAETVLELATSFADAGLPPGVVNIVTGVGETAGAALVEHADVDKIAFTGSVEVGKIVMRGAAGTLKKISLELGGKSPNVFFADADFEAAVDGALFGVFVNHGEVCSAGSRILVQRPIYEKFVDAMVAKAKTIKLGPGMDRDTKMGPLVSREHFDRVRRYQEIGKQEARLAVGGG